MNKEHLTHFKVRNFKRFDSLELTDIGQFNLIVGDNNVGKTSLLEALLFENDRIKCLGKLHKTLSLKGIDLMPKRVFGSKGEVTDIDYPHENFLTYLVNDLSKLIIIEGDFLDLTFEHVQFGMTTYDEFGFDPDTPQDPNHHFLGKSPDNRYIEFWEVWGYVEDMKHSAEHWNIMTAGLYSHSLEQDIIGIELPLISVSLSNNGTLSNSYFEFVNLSRQTKKQLIKEVEFVIKDIDDFEVRKIGGKDQLLVGVKNRDEMAPISTFGESVTRVLQILMEISKYRGKRLMIDEIDTGIHYSRMKNFLKTVFQVAEKNEVQLFMTTHSRECQQAFAEVFEDDDMKSYREKVRQFTLLEKQDGKVTAIGRNFEQLEFALQTDNETRGGN